jgi:hypothetical protein
MRRREDPTRAIVAHRSLAFKDLYEFDGQGLFALSRLSVGYILAAPGKIDLVKAAGDDFLVPHRRVQGVNSKQPAQRRRTAKCCTQQTVALFVVEGDDAARTFIVFDDLPRAAINPPGGY